MKERSGPHFSGNTQPTSIPPGKVSSAFQMNRIWVAARVHFYSACTESTARKPGILCRSLGKKVLFVTISDPSLGEVIGRHLQGDAISGQHSDAVPSQLPSQVREYRPILVQLHTEQTAWKLFYNCAGDFYTVFFTHSPLLCDVRTWVCSVRALGRL